jgi:hypothetical protein
MKHVKSKKLKKIILTYTDVRVQHFFFKRRHLTFVDQSFRAIAIQAVDHFPKTGYPIFRFAASSLDYDDTTTAVDYLQKALRIIQTGKE